MAFSVKASAEFLRDEMQNLFATSNPYGDTGILGASRCILAAASGQSVNIDGNVQVLKAARAEIGQALVDLIHCREVKLSGGADKFLDLFKLAKKMNIASCQEVCHAIVQDCGHNNDEIQLRLSIDQCEMIRQQLHQWMIADVPQWTDFAARVSGSEETIARAHVVLLAAHCKYFRALWAGSFQEKAVNAELTLEDSAEVDAMNMLLQIIYGQTVNANSEEQLVRLCCLADKWQCASVMSATLETMESQHAMVAPVAIDILGWKVPAPEVLVHAAARAIQRSQQAGDLTVQRMPILATCRLLNYLEIDYNDDALKETVQVRVLSGLSIEAFWLKRHFGSMFITSDTHAALHSVNQHLTQTNHGFQCEGKRRVPER